VREFIDNAIDAGAKNIEVTIEGGGAKLCEVSDDGSGIDADNLPLAVMPHSTSKIRGIADLSTVRTLGFRGEALAAASSVADLEITSNSDGSHAWSLAASKGELEIIPCTRSKGTSVRTRFLFERIPVRKRFLKRDSAEALQCKQIFVDKALAFPALNFRFVEDGRLVMALPPAETYLQRFSDTFSRAGGTKHAARNTEFLHEISAFGEGFTVNIVIGGPEIWRGDRRKQYIFANGRRIDSFAFLQAVEVGVQGFFPNGTHPVGAVFIDVDPALADFNIHPAKREARFVCSAEIHHAITETLRNHFRALLSPGASARLFQPFHSDARLFQQGTASGYALPLQQNPQAQCVGEKEPVYRGGEESLETDAAPPDAAFRYVGRAFGLFILVERGDRLHIIDQHAAHERVLYDRLLSKPIPRQELLAPIPFTTESREDDAFLAQERERLRDLGVVIEGENGAWRIEALPVLWRLGDVQTVRELLNLRTAGENIAERWAATIACHCAIRDGDYLDDESALRLAEELLERPLRTCPHGRPVLTEIKREDLFKAVRRT
jgi:DNA mismatch repair protein MutL